LRLTDKLIIAFKWLDKKIEHEKRQIQKQQIDQKDQQEEQKKSGVNIAAEPGNLA
jgi:hypothetical protein